MLRSDYWLQYIKSQQEQLRLRAVSKPRRAHLKAEMNNGSAVQMLSEGDQRVELQMFACTLKDTKDIIQFPAFSISQAKLLYCTSSESSSECSS